MASNIRMSMYAKVKETFFDRQAVKNAMDTATRKSLSRFGAFVRRTAKGLIRKRKKASPPGKPPSSHVGLLREGIMFGVDGTMRSVVIGPVLLPRNGPGDVPSILEYGGTKTLYVLRGDRGRTFLSDARNTGGKRRIVANRSVTANYAARPYMRPAFDKELPKASSLWANAVKK